MDKTIHAKLQDKTVLGQINSSINSGLSKIFTNTFTLRFKFKTNQGNIKMIIPCTSRNEVKTSAKELKQIRKMNQDVKVQYSALGNYGLITTITTTSNHTLLNTSDHSFIVNLQSDSSDGELDNDMDKVSDNEDFNVSDSNFPDFSEDSTNIGSISKLHPISTLDGNTVYGFSLHLLPFLNYNAKSGNYSCYTDNKDEYLGMKNMINELRHKNKVATADVQLNLTTLNIIGKPQIYYATHILLRPISKFAIKKRSSQKIAIYHDKDTENSLALKLTPYVNIHPDTKGSKPNGYIIYINTKINVKSKNNLKKTQHMIKGLGTNILLYLYMGTQMTHRTNVITDIPSMCQMLKGLFHINVSKNKVRNTLQKLINVKCVKIVAQKPIPKELVQATIQGQKEMMKQSK